MPKLALEVCAFVLGIPLEALVVAALLRGPYRRFPFVFVYMSVFFVVTLVEAPLCIATYGFGVVDIVTYARWYWIFEWILLPLIFLVVISLLYQATSGLPSRRTVRAALIGGAVLFAVATFAWYYAPGVKAGRWMTPWTGKLNFGAAILDLALWTFLIAGRRKEDQLLMLSGGRHVCPIAFLFLGNSKHVGKAVPPEEIAQAKVRWTVFDGRVIYGKITAAGLKLLREMDGPIEKQGREMLKHVSQGKLKQLIDLLELVRAKGNNPARE
ncbi:MAG: hypothetical protein LAQ30_26250 [Acidobacteriia bacterium]|nr:hypothetical protein [Terriglobia bacterium]